jgi:hypothetical protein
VSLSLPILAALVVLVYRPRRAEIALPTTQT